MTLDANKPIDQIHNSELPAYIREDRAAINAFSGTGGIAQTDLTVSAGQTSLSVGTELSPAGLETIMVTGDGVATISTILGGTDGQVKIFIFKDSNIDISDGNVKDSGKFYLNHLPAGSNFEAQNNDILVVRNVGGDGASTYGYWKELYRTISVK